jgi:hypothetical protein
MSKELRLRVEDAEGVIESLKNLQRHPLRKEQRALMAQTLKEVCSARKKARNGKVVIELTTAVNVLKAFGDGNSFFSF